MEFKEATDRLFDRVDHSELAKALGVSVPLIRQARLKEGAAARRSPPANWQSAVIKLAEAQEGRYRSLAAQLRSDAENSNAH